MKKNLTDTTSAPPCETAPPAPSTSEEFTRQFRSTVFKFLNHENSKYSVGVDREDFLQEVLLKFYAEGVIEKYDPEKASFKTFLSRVMRNIYFSMLRREMTVALQEICSEEVESIPVPREGIVDDSSSPARQQDVRMVIELIDRVQKIEERLLLKLKLYCDMFRFDADELACMATRLGKSPQETFEYILLSYRDKPGENPGLRNQDIEKLLPYRLGSISTLFKRLVRKFVIEPYIVLERHDN